MNAWSTKSASLTRIGSRRAFRRANRLDAYLARLAAVTTDDALLFCNSPALGADPVFGTVFPLYVDGWTEDAAAGKPFSRLHC